MHLKMPVMFRLLPDFFSVSLFMLSAFKVRSLFGRKSAVPLPDVS